MKNKYKYSIKNLTACSFDWKLWLHRLDTGRLNPETYRVFDKVEKHYGIRIEYTFPEAEETMKFVREKGMFSFYEDGHQECCRYRKVFPQIPFDPQRIESLKNEYEIIGLVAGS